MISRTLKYTLLTVILLAAMLVVSAVPVAAANSNAGNNQAKPLNGAAVDNLIEKLEPFVSRCNDGTFRLDIPANVKINKSSQEFQAILAGMNSVNELIRQGELVTTSDLTVYSVDGSQFVLQDGINLYKSRWYGFEIWLSHSVCQYIESGVLVGEGAAAIAAATGIGLPVALVIMAFIGVGGGILAIWDDGCGIHFKFFGGAPPVPFHLSAQTC
jgi:hypothetical protein